jgi:hypothetical protein
MTTAFISFAAAAGGNHLRNIISLGTDFLVDNPYKQSMKAQYTENGRMFVHGADIGTLKGNLTSFKLHQALMSPASNHIMYGHFAELMTVRDDIKSISDKKFILLSLNSSRCREIWIQRSKKLNMNIGDSLYYIGEQVFLYEAFMYYDVFKAKPANVMNIGISEWFSPDISDVLKRIEFCLNCHADVDLCQQLHEIWLSKNQYIL